MIIDKQDFIAWRENPVTQAFLEVVINEMNETVRDLVVNAGIDSGRDRLCVGRIQGLNWLADWQPDFGENGGVDES